MTLPYPGLRGRDHYGLGKVENGIENIFKRRQRARYLELTLKTI
jgi:hypothetical protein